LEPLVRRGIVPSVSVKRALALTVLFFFVTLEAEAWPTVIVKCLLRDARRVVPRSLARLIADRESLILDELQRFPPPLNQAFVADLAAGKLGPETLLALQDHAAEAVYRLRHQEVGEGVVRLGATLLIPASLSDPALTAGPEGYPAGVVQEYYAFIEANLDKIPVVLDDPPALKMESSRQLSAYWVTLLERSQVQSPVLRIELFQGGRLVDHRQIDYRSPVFGVASLSYSRAVTGIAATWMALWHEAHGDLTRMRAPIEVRPQAPQPTPPLSPRPPLEAPGP
jgi:hypothetical protein